MSVADSILTTIQSIFRVSMGEAQALDIETFERSYLISAVRADGGERWVARGPDRYETACALAELMGMELDDG